MELRLVLFTAGAVPSAVDWVIVPAIVMLSAWALGVPMAANSKGMIHKDFRIFQIPPGSARAELSSHCGTRFPSGNSWHLAEGHIPTAKNYHWQRQQHRVVAHWCRLPLTRIYSAGSSGFNFSFAENHAPVALSCFGSFPRRIYTSNFLRAAPSTPSRPVPSRSRLPGSGVVTAPTVTDAPASKESPTATVST